MCIFKSKKVKAPDTSAQEAEAARQRALEEQRYRERQAEEQARWDQQRADEERRYQEQLATQLAEAERQRAAMQAEIDRQTAETQRVEAEREAERQATLAQQEERARQSRAYVEGRSALIGTAQGNIEEAYRGFDDSFYGGVADAFVKQYAPELERQASSQASGAKKDAARAGNFNSSATARRFGDLAREKAAAQGQLAKQGQDTAQTLRNQVDGQKREALAALWSSGAVGAESLPDGYSDANTALGGIGAQLGSITQTARNSASKVTNPFF